MTGAAYKRGIPHQRLQGGFHMANKPTLTTSAGAPVADNLALKFYSEEGNNWDLVGNDSQKS